MLCNQACDTAIRLPPIWRLLRDGFIHKSSSFRLPQVFHLKETSTLIWQLASIIRSFAYQRHCPICSALQTQPSSLVFTIHFYFTSRDISCIQLGWRIPIQVGKLSLQTWAFGEPKLQVLLLSSVTVLCGSPTHYSSLLGLASSFPTAS